MKFDELRFISVADVHLRSADPWGRSGPDGINTRTARRLRALEAVVKEAIDRNVHFVNVLGDLFDHPNPPEWLRSKVWAVFAPLLERDDDWFFPVLRIIPGNHDWSGKSHPFSSDGILADLVSTRVAVFDRIGSVRHQLAGDMLVRCVYWPHHQRKGSKALSMLRSSAELRGVSILFSHFLLSDLGIPGTEFEPSTKDLELAWDLCVLGDYHDSDGGHGTTLGDGRFIYTGELPGSALYTVVGHGKEIRHEWLTEPPIGDDPFYSVFVKEDSSEEAERLLADTSAPASSLVLLVVEGSQEWFVQRTWEPVLRRLRERFEVVKVRFSPVLKDGPSPSFSSGDGATTALGTNPVGVLDSWADKVGLSSEEERRAAESYVRRALEEEEREL